MLCWAPCPLLPPLPLRLLLEYQFCPTSDTLPWVIEPDVESQSGDALLNAWHLVQIWRGLHSRYCLTSFPIPESPWGISSSVRVCVCFSSALPPKPLAHDNAGPCVGIKVIKCWNMTPIIPLLHPVQICRGVFFRSQKMPVGQKSIVSKTAFSRKNKSSFHGWYLLRTSKSQFRSVFQ